MLKSIASCVVLGALASFAGCTTVPTTSTVAGTVDQASLPSPIAKLTVLKSDGTSQAVAVDPQGHFTVPLDSGASYRLFLGADGKSIPVAVRSRSALGERLSITSGGASVDIGTIRYSAPAPAPMLQSGPVSADHPTLGMTETSMVSTNLVRVPALPGTPATPGATQSLPAAGESATVKCGDEDSDSDHHTKGHHHCMGHRHGSGDHHDDDGDRAGTNGDDDVDTTAPFAVASKNVDGDIGCDEDEDHDHHVDRDHGSDRHEADD